MSTEKLSIKETMRQIKEILDQNPESIKNLQGSYQFEITDGQEEIYQLHFAGGQVQLIEGDSGKVDCSLKMASESFHKFLSGKLNGTVALMTGKLKLNGDMTKALKLETLLKQYNQEQL